jgi:hypothetical protein
MLRDPRSIWPPSFDILFAGCRPVDDQDEHKWLSVAMAWSLYKEREDGEAYVAWLLIGGLTGAQCPHYLIWCQSLPILFWRWEKGTGRMLKRLDDALLNWITMACCKCFSFRIIDLLSTCFERA